MNLNPPDWPSRLKFLIFYMYPNRSMPPQLEGKPLLSSSKDTPSERRLCPSVQALLVPPLTINSFRTGLSNWCWSYGIVTVPLLLYALTFQFICNQLILEAFENEPTITLDKSIINGVYMIKLAIFFLFVPLPFIYDFFNRYLSSLSSLQNGRFAKFPNGSFLAYRSFTLPCLPHMFRSVDMLALLAGGPLLHFISLNHSSLFIIGVLMVLPLLSRPLQVDPQNRIVKIFLYSLLFFILSWCFLSFLMFRLSFSRRIIRRIFFAPSCPISPHS